VAEAPPRPAGFGRIYIISINVFGGAPRRLGPDHALDPSWSPKGDKIAYASPAGQIATIRVNGSGKRRVLLGTHGCYGPAWSANGQRLAMACGDRYGRHAYIDVANADGSDLRRLTEHAYNEYGLRWSPDGRTILYGRTNRRGIYLIGADGRNDRMITTDSPPPIGWGALTWSPNGRSIAYITDRTGDGDIYIIDADGRNKTQLTSSAEIDSDPAWAPR
jgi:TolB protein